MLELGLTCRGHTAHPVLTISIPGHFNMPTAPSPSEIVPGTAWDPPKGRAGRAGRTRTNTNDKKGVKGTLPSEMGKVWAQMLLGY